MPDDAVTNGVEPDDLARLGREVSAKAQRQAELLSRIGQIRGRGFTQTLAAAMERGAADLKTLAGATDLARMPADLRDYLVDAAQRQVLLIDTLRQANDAALARESEGLRPVLVFEYDVVVDGTTLARPVNYSLVRIRPPEGYPPPRPDGRPWMIIDPRAGQGSGIGGFKAESEVGVALDDGHPVYFVVFGQHPIAGQTLADVCAAEAHFLTRIAELHPASPRPLVTGNCQGGWAAMILAATHPELTGPLVIAGAPLSYWAGDVGHHPLRYLGGLVAGAVPALLAADLGDGTFDGASLILNFEALNPSRTWWRKYADLYADIDRAGPDYLAFDRWWSGYYFMTGAEIRWIVENLFVGDRLARGRVVLDDGTRVDLTAITAPIVVFASHGDNITPPQQALRWILDCYGSADEIRRRGRVIIYTLHDSIGHLGIFVSASVANDQHREITSVVKLIESLAPGLYEMTIAGPPGKEVVSFEVRDTAALTQVAGTPASDGAFAAAAELSEWMVKGYEMSLRPWIRALVTPEMARTVRELHPLRQQTHLLSTRNPLLASAASEARAVAAARRRAEPDNPFLLMEAAWRDAVTLGWDLVRDGREFMMETGFHLAYAGAHLRDRPDLLAHATRHAPEREGEGLKDVLVLAEKGGYPEAIVRMIVLLARAGGAMRKDRLAQFSAMMHTRAPFDTMTAPRRRQIIDEQTRVVDMLGDDVLGTLPKMLRDDVDRLRAVNLVQDLTGIEEQSEATLAGAFDQIQVALRTRARNWGLTSPEIAATRAVKS